MTSHTKIRELKILPHFRQGIKPQAEGGVVFLKCNYNRILLEAQKASIGMLCSAYVCHLSISRKINRFELVSAIKICIYPSPQKLSVQLSISLKIWKL